MAGNCVQSGNLLQNGPGNVPERFLESLLNMFLTELKASLTVLFESGPPGSFFTVGREHTLRDVFSLAPFEGISPRPRASPRLLRPL